MPFPIRCFTCGKPLGNYESFVELQEKGYNEYEALDKMRFTRMCCRRMFLCHNPELDEKLLMYDTSSLEEIEEKRD